MQPITIRLLSMRKAHCFALPVLLATSPQGEPETRQSLPVHRSPTATATTTPGSTPVHNVLTATPTAGPMMPSTTLPVSPSLEKTTAPLMTPPPSSARFASRATSSTSTSDVRNKRPLDARRTNSSSTPIIHSPCCLTNSTSANKELVVTNATPDTPPSSTTLSTPDTPVQKTPSSLPTAPTSRRSPTTTTQPSSTTANNTQTLAAQQV